jgi:NADP-dependent 3-hydroxy acid dehydrogenase YdfG
MLATTLRWEILGDPVRIIEIAPGAVATEEFSMVRFDGDSERAAAVYAGYEPLVADDIADAIAWSLGRPAHVNIDLLVVRPRAQASNNRIVRTGA